MHKLIYAIVEASTQDDALTIGKLVFDRIVNGQTYAGSVFDYYVCFDQEDLTVAGKDRWGELPVAAPVDSERGQELLDRGWEATQEKFDQHLTEIEDALDTLNDEQIMENVDQVRQTFRQVGLYEGPSISLYNKHGAGIRNRNELHRTLEESDDLWIVPADVHY